MKKEMLINVLQPEESRIAIVEDGVLEELYVERSSAENYVGNIYKGRVVRVLPGMQAAFVDIGLEKAAFLYVADVFDAMEEYESFMEGNGTKKEDGQESSGSDEQVMHPMHPIEDLLQEGQETHQAHHQVKVILVVLVMLVVLVLQ